MAAIPYMNQPETDDDWMGLSPIDDKSGDFDGVPDDEPIKSGNKWAKDTAEGFEDEPSTTEVRASATDRSNLAYIGQTAAKADRSHGAATDGRMHSRGGPMHPDCGPLEEDGKCEPMRLAGVEKLKANHLKKMA